MYEDSAEYSEREKIPITVFLFSSNLTLSQLKQPNS